MFSISSSSKWCHYFLQEKEKEMQLAMEERDLQKMATLSQQDTLRDELQAQIEKIKKV